ncbi:hypothetical protein [Nakamurella endophytica]|uniref:Uncharacterized protein n=1 Tax=Nakamurella endophytica TaxID=1748367 RepID=A0A917WCJ6_9ACTN|nr:hypothetical protein [Nakamurella endophytica]GGL92958.1 hypothetical protein GCM10011594_10970 [Nakamurella endophytica]
MRWWLAAATFVLGLVVGAVVVGLLSEGSPAPVATPATTSPSAVSPSTSAMPAPSSGATAEVSVNDACLRAINEAQDAYALVQDVADAVRSLNASRLDDIIRRLQPLQQNLRNDVTACRVTTRLPNGATVSSGVSAASDVPGTTVTTSQR